MSGVENEVAGWESLFFAGLLAAMAVIPLVSRQWWSRWYPAVTLALALPCALLVWQQEAAALAHVAAEYVSFLLLLAALYIVSGGIVIETPARGRPGSNALFLLTGAVLANVLGTTGASVVLIRPLLRANGWRQHKMPICVFFIFLVSNMGGMLTPLGDPPLFLGYLRGVPFFWTWKLLPVWSLAVIFLVVLYMGIDGVSFRREDRAAMPAASGGFELHGARNVVLLLVIVGSLFLPSPAREGVMGLVIVLSVLLTPPAIRRQNDFTYHPIIEVAILFAGIFVTMIPVQSLISVTANGGGGLTPLHCFWMAGGLSSVLDNAPTYLVFMEALKASAGSVATRVAGVPEVLLMALSAGCVMMGANTYIGNGPNLMVKAICEDEGVKMPSFLGYIGWAALILLPLYAVVSWVFFIS